MDLNQIEEGFKLILKGIGEDVNREGLINTPKRVAKMYGEILDGMHKDPKKELGTVFTEQYDEIILLKNIPFTSLCEHHFLPFTGQAAIGYIPKDKVVGLSKLARVIETLSHRPQIQERLTNQVADTIFETLDAIAVGVVIESSHSCMTIRGIKKPGSLMITSAIRGTFRHNQASRDEFFKLVG